MTIEKRLEKLERQNRMFKHLLLLVCMAIGLWLIAASDCGIKNTLKAGESSKVIESNEFRLIDPKGKIRGVFGLDKDGGPNIYLLDAHGNSRAGVNLVEDADGLPAIFLKDAQGKVRGMFCLRLDDSPGIFLKDAQGKTRGIFGLRADESPGINLFDAEEKPRAVFAINADNSLGIDLLDAQGRVRGSFGIAADGRPAIALLDAQGKHIWSEP
jgi:hypothetical protein